MNQSITAHSVKHADGTHSLALHLTDFHVNLTAAAHPFNDKHMRAEIDIYSLTPARIMQLGIAILQEAHIIIHREAAPVVPAEDGGA